MNIIIFGATGGTGKQLIDQALQQGHQVTAFVRDVNKVNFKNNQLTIFEGDVLNVADVEAAINGHDAVLCALGMPNIFDKSSLRKKGTKNIIKAMQQLNINRLICQSSLGAGDSYAKLPLLYRAFIAPIFMRNLYKDHNAQEKIIKESSLNWTIVRPGVLNDGELTKNYKNGTASDTQKIKTKISRADVADFMLKQLNTNALLSQTPYLSY